MCPSSGEPTVSMRHWYFSLFMGGCLVCRKKKIGYTGMHGQQNTKLFQMERWSGQFFIKTQSVTAAQRGFRQQ